MSEEQPQKEADRRSQHQNAEDTCELSWVNGHHAGDAQHRDGRDNRCSDAEISQRELLVLGAFFWSAGAARLEAGVAKEASATGVLQESEEHADGGQTEAEVPGRFRRDALRFEESSEGLRLCQPTDG